MTVRENSLYSWVPISSESMAYPTFSLVQYSLSLLFQFEILELISIKCSRWLASSTTKIKVASYHLRRIGSIRKYITAGICHKLVVALVTSNIDYCNGLLGGQAAKDVDRLQRLQHRAARLVTRSKAAMHITPIHKDLHWLPIQERINYKIIVTVYKCIHRLAPNYLSSILTTRTRDNRLCQKQVCHELKTHSCAKVVGKQAFGTRAPELWNKLSLNIRTIPTLQSFKQTLKTHLFQSAYRLLWWPTFLALFLIRYWNF